MKVGLIDQLMGGVDLAKYFGPEVTLTRVAHFLVENQETGNERTGNFLQEITLFLENFLVLTIID